jgi:hypothetical protein
MKRGNRMDERLKKALDYSNYMITLNNQKRILKEQYQNDLLYYFNGGQFTVTQQLISFCQSLIDLNQEETVLVDDNDIPIEVENIIEFTKNIVNTYFVASNRYLTEYNKLKTNRSVEGIITG